MVITTVLFILYSIDVLLLFVFGANLIYMILKSRRTEPCSTEKPPELTEYPFVTVQLPIFNEQYVARRIIRGAAALDYPKDRFEIQVLDDSTDETLRISENTVDALRREGYSITLRHRKDRTGQKGGALREALKDAAGEYILIFDADFLPVESILNDTLGYFLRDTTLGFIQTRWGHINTEYSSLTKAQSLVIDGHFVIEQSARDSENLFLNFNGTGGIWRKQCILDSGNWQDDTLTEDMDLSYRAQLTGWRVKYLPHVVNPSELPAQINGYKSQQFRWAKGSIQTALKLGPALLSSDEPVWKKIQGMLHLTYYSVHPLLILNIALIIPLLLISDSLRSEPGPWVYRILIFFSAASAAPPLFFSYGQYRLYRDWKRRLLWIPLAIFLGTGVALNNTRAVLEAVFGKKSEFIRTPKFGIVNRFDSWKKKQYTTRFSAFSVPEALTILYLTAGIILALHSGFTALLPFLIYYFISFGYVFTLSLIHGTAGVKLKGAVNEEIH
jgi:cellulose synthase/poly-beta-1,6-N-acetylglucosamine synthase-like glycosyltransferase